MIPEREKNWLQYAEEKQSLTVDDWVKVVFSDRDKDAMAERLFGAGQVKCIKRKLC